MRTIRKKKMKRKEIKKELDKNSDFHLLMFAIYWTAGTLLKKFRLHNQLGIITDSECQTIRPEDIKIKSLKNYMILSEFPYMKETIAYVVKSMIMLNSTSPNLESRIYKDEQLGATYHAMAKESTNILLQKWRNNVRSVDNETHEALFFLLKLIAEFKVIEFLVSKKDIEIDRNVRKYIRTMVTKFNRYFLSEAKEIIESAEYDPVGYKKIIDEFREAGLIPEKKRRRG